MAKIGPRYFINVFQIPTAFKERRVPKSHRFLPEQVKIWFVLSEGDCIQIRFGLQLYAQHLSDVLRMRAPLVWLFDAFHSPNFDCAWGLLLRVLFVGSPSEHFLVSAYLPRLETV